ncbi:MAG: 30S ribosomal protein S3 [Spirochaetes bacterium]|nr:30S ribosomal protein S3 [Spirochaetota bacterium]
MGQKVNPISLRLGINKTWASKWFDSRNYAKNLHEDIKLRQAIDDFYSKTLKEEQKKMGGKRENFDPAISSVELVRFSDRINVFIHSARPGVVIGPKGARVELLKNALQKYTTKPIQISIKEIKQPDIDAAIVAQSVARQLENRISFRRAMKQAVSQAMRNGAKGIKVVCAGRLGGADIARTEKYMEGSVPLHTLRADIDYGTARALTTYGISGVKVWIYKGEILDKKDKKVQDDAGKVVTSKGVA